MNCTLYSNLSDTNVLTKSITAVSDAKSCTLKNNTSIQQPDIILDVDSATLAGANYFYLDEVDRYYYIDNAVLLTGGRWQISGRCDVLMSFNSAIQNLVCIVDKQNMLTNASMYVDDGDFVTENRRFNTVINFPNSLLESGEFILITAGGQGS